MIDLGFHVLHTAYPALHRWVDVEALNAKPMDACTMTIHPKTGKRRVLGDALRARNTCFRPNSVGVMDGLRFLRWRLSTSGKDSSGPWTVRHPPFLTAYEPAGLGHQLAACLNHFRRHHLGPNAVRADGVR